jgi:hypothetical protein
VLETLVRVTFSATDDLSGSYLRVEHSTYPDTPEGLEWRQSHLDGWLYFLARLAEVPRRRVS